MRSCRSVSAAIHQRMSPMSVRRAKVMTGAASGLRLVASYVGSSPSASASAGIGSASSSVKSGRPPGSGSASAASTSGPYAPLSRRSRTRLRTSAMTASMSIGRSFISASPQLVRGRAGQSLFRRGTHSKRHHPNILPLLELPAVRQARDPDLAGPADDAEVEALFVVVVIAVLRVDDPDVHVVRAGQE